MLTNLRAATTFKWNVNQQLNRSTFCPFPLNKSKKLEAKWWLLGRYLGLSGLRAVEGPEFFVVRQKEA